MNEEKIELIKQIADFIIENECAYSKAASHFKISKTTVGKYMKEFLSKIDSKRYANVKEIVDGNKSGNITIEDVLRIEQEYILYLEGYTLMQISEITGNNYSLVQRDLSNTLKKLDKEKHKQVEEISYQNMRWNVLSEEEKENLVTTIELYYQLCLKGYKIDQIAYLTGSSYSSVQRGLSFIQVIDIEKYNLVKKQLNENQEKTQIKKKH